MYIHTYMHACMHTAPRQLEVRARTKERRKVKSLRSSLHHMMVTHDAWRVQHHPHTSTHINTDREREREGEQAREREGRSRARTDQRPAHGEKGREL